MSVYDELIRLLALYTAAVTDPYSCPRDRQILLAKITDLEEEASRLKTRARRSVEASEAEVERISNANRLREGFRPKPLDEGGLQRFFEALESDHIRLWEAEHQY